MMKAPSSTTVTIFILFFGVSVLDAFATRNWWRAAFWMVVAFGFYAADRKRRYLPDRLER